MDDEDFMTDLVDDAEDPQEDYLEGTNKEVVTQDPDPDKVVKADLEMDPAAATESFVRRKFGMSSEDIAEVSEEIVEEANTIIENEPIDGEVSGVVESDGGDTTVEVSVASDDLGSSDDLVGDITEDDVMPEIQSASDIAAVENLNRILSMEDGESESDVSIDVETPNNDVNIEMDDKAITIEPNSDDDDGSDDLTGSDDDDDTDDTDGSDDDDADDESSEESWYI